MDVCRGVTDWACLGVCARLRAMSIYASVSQSRVGGPQGRHEQRSSPDYPSGFANKLIERKYVETKSRLFIEGLRTTGVHDLDNMATDHEMMRAYGQQF